MKQIKKGYIFVLSGPSGSGKTTLLTEILKDSVIAKHVQKSISVTTRPKRNVETEGKDYFFLTQDEFLRQRREKKILEWTQYLGYYYGTPKDWLRSAVDSGLNIGMCLDHRGVVQVKKLFPKNSVSIFVLPPSLDELQVRMEKRCAKADPDEIKRRLLLAKNEMKHAGEYDFTILNANMSRAVRELKRIVKQYLKIRRGTDAHSC